MTGRRYDDEEVAMILHRAAEAAAGGRERGRAAGLSLAELKEIGTEAGIGASRIEEAAKAMEMRSADSPAATSMGFPPTVQLERVVPVRLNPDNLPQLLDLIRDEFARQGIVQEVLGGFEWRASSIMGGRYVSIRAEGESTGIRALGNYRDGLLTFALGPGPILGVCGGLLAAALAGPNPFVVAPAGLLAWASALVPWRVLFGRENNSLRRVLDSIERRLRELA